MPYDYKRPSGLLIVLTIAASLLGMRLLYVYLSEPTYFPVNTIKIEASYQHISHKEWETVLSAYTGYSFFTFPVSQLKKALADLAWAQTVAVKRVWPDIIKITLVEKTPVAIMNHALMTKDGLLFNQGNDLSAYELPVLKSPIGQEKEVLQVFEKLSKILTCYGLHAMTFTMRENGACKLKLSNGILLRLGKKDFELRVLRFSKAYPAIQEGQGRMNADQIESVDLRYPRGMAVQWKNKRENNG